MLQMLRDYPQLDTVILCLDHDPAGIEACGRLAEILVQSGHTQIQSLQPAFKDWNEDLKNLHGKEAAPAQEHPKITECGVWISLLKQVAESVDGKYATKSYVCRYYQDIYEALKREERRSIWRMPLTGRGCCLPGCWCGAWKRRAGSLDGKRIPDRYWTTCRRDTALTGIRGISTPASGTCRRPLRR